MTIAIPLPPLPRGRRPNTRRDEAICLAIAQGQDVAAVAAQHGLSETRVKGIYAEQRRRQREGG